MVAILLDRRDRGDPAPRDWEVGCQGGGGGRGGADTLLSAVGSERVT